ncbi:MAG TPA: DUF1501 domain-containing protein [Pirellulaceae bacterium]|nr:DUF1501 domain-containing protein [Pirellulaceae bacterium]
MLSLQDGSGPRRAPRLCDGLSRREMLRIGSLGLVGLSLPDLLRGRTVAQELTPRAVGKAKSCILLFLLGGPPQHSTWDPKPQASEEIRGAFGPISTRVPGVQYAELLERTARVADRIAVLRAVQTGDHAHSSSGYAMMTGVPHQPLNRENANPGAPNDWPTIGAVVQHLHRGKRVLPPAVRLPHHIFNTDQSVWPGQTSGFLGADDDPWMFRCEPNTPGSKIPDFSLPVEVPLDRFESRTSLLSGLDARLRDLDRLGAFDAFDRQTQQAFDLLTAPASFSACDLTREPDAMRDRYGRTQFGQSVLMARRLVEAGVTLVQVNWFRGADEPADAPCWDSHARETQRLKENLGPPFDQAFATLIEDLEERGMLDETLVVAMAEFGRTPKFNAQAGRDHWGNVFSIALAGGGVRGGTVHGASDNQGAFPIEGLVGPADVAATIFHSLGYAPDTEIRDVLDRPLPISRGQVIRSILG